MVTPTPTTVQVKIQLRGDTAANWASVNPVLLNNELGLETDTKKIKVGNGSTAWNSLAYFPFVVSGGTVTGNLEIGTTGTLTFEGSTADGFETALGVVNPTADRTINLPNVSGTIITTGDTGTVTSTMIADGTIVNADVSASAAIAHSKLANITAGYVLIGNASNVPTATAVTGDVTIDSTGVTSISSGSIVDGDVSASAEIAVSKLADGAARQLLQTDAAGTGVEWTDNVDVPGTLDVTGAATFDANVTIEGDLTVNGTTTTIDTETLLVKDKNIELAVVDTPTDLTADGGGITLKGATDKTITWSDTTDAWTSNQVFDVPAGSAAAPSLIFSADVNSGIYSPGSDQVAISTGGTGRLFVDASGRVGVGVQADSSAQFRSLVGTSGKSWSAPTGTSALFERNSVNYVTIAAANNNTAQLNFADTDDVDIGFLKYNHSEDSLAFGVNNSERLRITSDGKFGIGTSAPGAILHATSADDAKTAVLAGATSRIRAFGHLASFGGSIIEATNNAESAFAPLLLNGSSLTLGNNGTAIATVTSVGVGIGTTAPATQLHAYAASGAVTLRAQSGANVGDFAQSGTELYIVNAANGPINFWNNGSEKARIDSSGRLLVGHSSVAPVNTPKICTATTGLESSLSLAKYRNSASISADLDFVKSRSGTLGTAAAVSTTDSLGAMRFYGAGDASTYVEAARITAKVDGGTVSSTSLAGSLIFSTTPDGSATPVERMRIDSSGAFYIGVTSTPDGTTTGGSAFIPESNNRNTLYLATTATSSRNLVAFNNGNGLVGTISVSGTATAYNTSSDYRLKENVVPLTGASNRLNQLQVHRFNFIADPDTTVDGFIAHEAQAVVPECVTGSKDEVDDEGNPVYQGIDQSKLVPLLTAALQEAMERIEVLEAKVNALEGN